MKHSNIFNVCKLRRTSGAVVVFCGLLAGSLQGVAQQAPRPITWKDVASWKSLAPNGAVLNPNGKWVAYGIVPVDGDGELMLQKVNDTTLHKFPIGGSSFLNMAFSENGRYLAFLQAPSAKEQKAAAKPGGRQVFSKLHLRDLEKDTTYTFEKVASFAFSGKLSTHLGMMMAKERTAGGTATQGSDFMLLDLATQQVQNIGNVASFSFNKEGKWLAYTIDAANQAGNGIQLLYLPGRQFFPIDAAKATYEKLSWQEDGNALAVLKMVKDDKYKQPHGSVIGVRLNGLQTDVVQYNPQKDSTRFPKGYTISGNGTPEWTEDLTRIVFGIHAQEPAKKEPATAVATPNKDSLKKAEADQLAKLKSDTAIKSLEDLQKALAKINAKPAAPQLIDTVKPDMAIWHWADKRLQSRQQVMQQADKNFYYRALYDTRSGTFTRLNDSTVRSLSVLPKGRFALANDQSLYEWDSNLDGQSYQDLYIVDLTTGASRVFMQKFYLPSFSSYPRGSPDGLQLLYAKDGHYYIYDMVANTHRNITEGLPVSFVNTEDDHNVVKPMVPALGWSADSRFVLLRDLWDIWLVPTGAQAKEKAMNLTVNGKAERIRYQSRFVLDPDEKGIDLTQAQYLRMYGEWNKKSGIALLPAVGKAGIKAGVQVLLWQDANMGRLAKAKNAAVWMYSSETELVPTEYFASTSPQLSGAAQVTKNAPDLAKYTWNAGVRLINYVSAQGDSLQGALWLPAGYQEGKKYPTIVYYYEKLSQTARNWSNPGFSGTGWNPAVYTSNGYAVFIPDIVYKLNDPGMSAVWCVVPAVKAAIATGVVDPERIGAHGHSWGGYQTCFLITQTNMFKAAAAGAPLTNMISMYDLIYWNSGSGNMSIFEASQGRFTGGPWELWNSYQRNSPVFHVKKVETPLLMLHNDKDGAVDFTQGIEYYNALRRLKKPVAMMQYKGENHGLSKLENKKDYSVRMMEFFDHYLKGAPAPDWWAEGVDHLKLSEHLEKRVY